MWLLEGRFAEESRQELSKLLKCGETYTIGRKIPADIIVDSKFVSRTSCHITVGDVPAYPADLDPERLHTEETLRPKVTIRFEASKSRQSFGVMQKPRNSDRDAQPVEVHVAAGQESVLRDQDSFALTTTISLRLVWRPFAVCFAGRIKEVSIAPLRPSASRLGLFLSPAKARWRNGYTVLSISQVKPTESVINALVQAKPVVTLDFFVELIRRGNLPRHDPASLETNIADLDPAEYQPEFSQAEFSDMTDLPQKILPNPKRTYMLQGTSCVFFVLPSDENEFAIYRNILALAGARVYSHNPDAEHLSTKSDFASLLMPLKNSALSYWRNSGAKARGEAPDDGLVVLCSSTHDNASWKTACTLVCSNLRIAMPSGFHAISNAIFSADVREHFNIIPSSPEAGFDSSPPAAPAPTADDVTTIEELQAASPHIEPGAPQTPEGDTVGLLQSTSPPAVLDQETISAEALNQPRRPLKRRTQKASVKENELAMQVDSAGSHPGHNAALSATGSQGESAAGTRSHSRLTRRTGTDRQVSRRSDVFDALLRSGNDEALLLKHGDGSAVSVMDAKCSASIVPRSRQFRMQLDEQDKAESQAESPTNTASFVQGDVAARKRKQASAAAPVEGSDRAKRARTARTPEPEYPSQSQICLDDDDMQESAMGVAQVIRHERSENNLGLIPGAQPDTEPDFLQALNTQRAKGRRMDEFDTDFNNLRIAKPNQLNDREANKHTSNFSSLTGQTRRQQEQSQAAQRPPDEEFEAFKKLAQEDLRIHVRGNFVQVGFVPLIHRKDPTATQNTISNNGVPNFKKFRPKGRPGQPPVFTQATAPTRAAVSLSLTKTNDYGLGDAYWNAKGSANPLGGDDDRIRVHSDARARTTSGPRSRRGTSVVNLDLSGESDGQTGDFSLVPNRNARQSAMNLDDSEVDELQSSAANNLDLDGLDSLDEIDDADLTKIEQRQRQTSRAGGKQSAATSNPAARSKRAAPASRQSDDEEERYRIAHKRPALSLDLDDSDDDVEDDNNGDFAGFGKSTSKRNHRQVHTTRAAPARTRRTAF